MAPVIKSLEGDPRFISKVVTTGQHREMLKQVLKTFLIIPDYDLNIMEKNQTLSGMTSKILLGLEPIFIQEKPDLVLVHGDTTTTLAATLAAFYAHTPIGHVEAGLRTYNKFSPYPEEINRQVTDLIADLYFAPTKNSWDNLKNENHSGTMFITGNTAIDALYETIKQPVEHPLLKKLSGKKFILLTMHRRENLGENMHQIFLGVKEIVEQYPELNVVFPMHPNPLVRKTALNDLDHLKNVHLIDSLEPSVFQHFLKSSYLAVSDSGGIQEEAPALNVPLLVLRDTTERPEGIENGNMKLIGTNKDTFVREVSRLLDNKSFYEQMALAKNPYGDGKAARRIVQGVASYFNLGEAPEDFRV